MVDTLTPTKTKDIKDIWEEITQKHPEVKDIKTDEQWTAWANNNPEYQSSKWIWETYKILSTIGPIENKTPETQEEEKKHTASHQFYPEHAKEKQETKEEKEEIAEGEKTANSSQPPIPQPVPQASYQPPRSPSQTFQRPQGQGLSTRAVNFGNRAFSSAQAASQARSALGKQASKAASNLGSLALKQAWLRVALYVGGPLLLILLFTAIIAFLPIGGATTGEASPVGGSPSQTNSLDYTISFRDTTIIPIPLDQIKNRILARWPKAHLQDWQHIINQSILNKWNPAFVLALWIEESGAQGEPSYSDALGCDPKHPTTDLDRSLTCLFNSFPIERYPNTNFADFMCVYGGDGFHRAPCVFEIENKHFPPDIKDWYSQLVPSGSGALTTVQPSPSSGQIVPVGQGGARIADAAFKIAGQLSHSDDRSKLSYRCDLGDYTGFHCWQNAPSFDQATNPYYLECTEFIWAVFKTAGYEKEIDLIRHANAQDWSSSAINNGSGTFDVFTDANKLDQGDIISIGTPGVVGHVAIVIERGYDTVKVAQAATDSRTETWDIDLKNHTLKPIGGGDKNRPTRYQTIGFIRVKTQ